MPIAKGVKPSRESYKTPTVEPVTISIQCETEDSSKEPIKSKYHSFYVYPRSQGNWSNSPNLHFQEQRGRSLSPTVEGRSLSSKADSRLTRESSMPTSSYLVKKSMEKGEEVKPNFKIDAKPLISRNKVDKTFEILRDRSISPEVKPRTSKSLPRTDSFTTKFNVKCEIAPKKSPRSFQRKDSVKNPEEVRKKEEVKPTFQSGFKPLISRERVDKALEILRDRSLSPELKPRSPKVIRDHYSRDLRLNHKPLTSTATFRAISRSPQIPLRSMASQKMTNLYRTGSLSAKKSSLKTTEPSSGPSSLPINGQSSPINGKKIGKSKKYLAMNGKANGQNGHSEEVESEVRCKNFDDKDTPQFQFSVVVAIDFGTTFSGYAYSFTHDPENIHIMRKWEGKN